MNLSAIGTREVCFSNTGGNASPDGIQFFMWDTTLWFSSCWKTLNLFVCWIYKFRKKLRESLNIKKWRWSQRFLFGEVSVSWVTVAAVWAVEYSSKVKTKCSLFPTPYRIPPHPPSSTNNKTFTMLKSLVRTWEVNNVVPALFGPFGYLGEQHSFF